MIEKIIEFEKNVFRILCRSVGKCRSKRPTDKSQNICIGKASRSHPRDYEKFARSEPVPQKAASGWHPASHPQTTWTSWHQKMPNSSNAHARGNSGLMCRMAYSTTPALPLPSFRHSMKVDQPASVAPAKLERRQGLTHIQPTADLDGIETQNTQIILKPSKT